MNNLLERLRGNKVVNNAFELCFEAADHIWLLDRQLDMTEDAVRMAKIRIEQLERENQQHLDYINTLCQEIKTEQRLSFRVQVARLERENAALRKDAERYRWLRDEAQWLDGVPQAIIWKSNGDVQEICAEDELDAAVDAAIDEAMK